MSCSQQLRIVEVIQEQRELMTEQCAFLKVIAENQQELWPRS